MTTADIEKARPVESEEAQKSEFGIAFDGRNYRYREYRYDRVTDAIAYAKLDRSRPGYHAQAFVQPQWQEPKRPSALNQEVMDKLGISFDGKNYRFGEYRYDQFADAIRYAELRR
jgi:hypothetical protein